MLRAIFWLFCITLIPGLELRASIPVGFFREEFTEVLPWPAVSLFCFLANVLIGCAVFLLLHTLMTALRRFPLLDRWITAYQNRSQKKLEPSLRKYGFWGLALFIGIPLPMTGAYTGAAGAFALGMPKRQFFLANLAGVALADLLVTLLCLLIRAGCQIPLLNLFLKQTN